MKIFISILFALTIMSQAGAQTKSNDELLGDKYMFSYSYDLAVKSYSKAKVLSTAGSRNLAMCYHKLDKDLQSDSVYNTYIVQNKDNVAEDYYNYAQVLKCIGKVNLSNQYMDKFVLQKPNDLRGIDYTANKHLYDTWLVDNKVIKIEYLKINTSADDFGPTFYKDKIVFTSSRSDGKSFPKLDNWHNQPYLDMYVAEVSENQLLGQLNFSSELNGKMHDGPASFTKDGNTIVFTRNNYDDKSKDRVIELQLFFSKFSDGKWSSPEPFAYNNVDYSVGHPAISPDGNTLYFSSNMSGGFGKADIYKCNKNSEGKWSKPENMGSKINTEGDDVFPFFEGNSQTLFYSSDGKFGLGGLDIFTCKIDANGVGEVINLGSPLNSTFDDFSAIANDKMTRGYFASNRKGGAGADDLYAFEIPYNQIPRSVKGIVSQKSGVPINKVMVNLINADGQRLDSILTNGTGTYQFKLEKSKGYTIVAKNMNYFDGNVLVQSTDPNEVIIANITLLKIPVSEQIKPKANLSQVLELNEIYFGLNQSTLTQESIIELEKIVTILNEYPYMIVDVHSYTDCRASVGYNQRLSDQRARTTLKYIRSRITKPLRISGKGYGESKLSSNCPCENNNITHCTDEEYKAQRNTEFIIVSQ